MEKLNDYFLNLLNNPTFGADDFSLVGLSIDNTSILNKELYQNSNYIRNLDVFKTNGEFDLAKFDNFYDYAKLGFIDLAKIKENEDIGKTWMAYRNDITMPETLRDKRPQFKIEKVANPLRLQEGFISLGIKEDPTQSIREIAQTLLVEDYKTGKLSESPNDSWLENFWNPKVLATWDSDGNHTDPITGELKTHKKGDRKLNANGTYYYENLGDRSIYGKEVLSGFDTLTTDDSAWNSIDFLDSDDLEKTTGGALMRTAAQIVPAFIPGVNTWYIGARVGLGLSQILPAVGKTLESLTGINTENSFFNNIEALDKTFSFSLSDYVQGSQDDNGNILLDSHLWSLETGLKLVADVFTQLAEQRWMFEKSTSMFSGLNKDVISSLEARTKWIQDYIKNNTKAKNIEEILSKGVSKGVDPRTQLATAENVNWLKAEKVLEEKLNGALKLGSKLSMAYMTGITTASSYGEAKEAGANDFEAGLFTLGYSFLEWKLLNSDLGKWILPELKSEERHIKNVINKAMPKIKEATSKADTTTEIGKAKWYQKIFNIGKEAYRNNLGEGIANEAVGSTISNMASEALEETSEELLLDFSKTIFNLGTSLVGSEAKFNDAFKNVFDRYALSFLGGAVGGGIAGTLPAYKQAKKDRNITQEAATKEIVSLILQGKDLLLIDTVNKMTFGNKYLDEEGNLVSDITKSQDYWIKLNFSRLVNDIKDILEVNGANLDKDSLLKELSPKDIRYGMFASLASEKSNAIGWYINRYNELSSQLVSKSLELKKLTDTQTDLEKRNTSKETSEKESLLKNEIKEIKEELDKFKDGTMSDEFIMDSLFEMISKISGVYIPTLEQKIKKDTGKNIEELSASERKEWSDQFDASRPVRRDLVRMARMLHILNMEHLSEVISKFNEEFFKDQNAAINNFNEILYGHRLKVIENPDNAVPTAERFLATYEDKINPLLYFFQLTILSLLEESKAKVFKEKIKSIMETPDTLDKYLGIPTLPKTVELLNALDLETKKKLLAAFGLDDISDVENIIKEDYIEDLVDELNNVTGQILNKKFNDSIRNWEKRNSIQKATNFNDQLIKFLLDENVKDQIIKQLKSAKYMLPTVRLALTDFFTTNVTAQFINPETDEEEEAELNDKIVKEYLDSFKDVPNSPIDVYLDNIVTTLKSKGVKISPLVSNINELVSKLAIAKNLESFAYDDNIENTINEALDILSYAEVGLDSAATTINGDLSDAFGFNVSINEIRAKRNKKGKELATIPSDIAELIKQDIERYRQDLLFFKTLLAYNSNLILNEHDKTYKLLSLNLYNRLKVFVGHLETPDWNDIDKLKEVLNDGELSDLYENLDKLGNDLESKDKLTAARLKIDKAVYNFFLANSNKLRGFKTLEEKNKAIESLANLLKDLNVLYSATKEVNTTINIEEKSLPDKDFLWYLASMAAADPEAILNDYSDVISGLFAPVIGQEEAIRTALSFLSDPKVFNLFADAFNLNLKNSENPNRKYLAINAFRNIFIEGVPGSGKSSATLKTLTDILSVRKPELLKNLVVVSNSKENAKTLVKNLGLDPSKIQYFGIEEFRGKIMNNYKPLETDSEGALKVKENEDVEWDDLALMYKYKNFSLNSNGLDASMLIIDEATSLSQMDSNIISKYMESKEIYGVYAGDFDQLGATGEFSRKRQNPTTGKEETSHIYITLDITNYISTHKLGLVIRGNNTYKSNNTISLKTHKYSFIDSLLNNGKSVPIDFSYYMDNSGVYGDVVTKADSINGIPTLDVHTKTIIDNMVKSLLEGEKINYIYDKVDTEMYKYLHENYADKINEISTKAAQSLEGQYYIVDIGMSSNLPRDAKGLDAATNRFKTLYTAISRAKQATLIFDRAENNEVISDRIKSTQINKLTKSNIGLEARQRYADSRRTSIKRALNNSDKHISFDLKKENLKSLENPLKKSDEELNEEDTLDQQIDIRNEQKEPDIKNESESELNMMIHSFNTHECGGFIDENGLLVLGERGTRIKLLSDGSKKWVGQRIDNANGIVKALKLEVDSEGKLSKEDTLRVLKILHKCRVAGLYKKSNEDIVSDIKDAFDLGSRDNVSVRFIYKNTQTAPIPNTIGGPISKFFRGIKEKLMYLFNGETDLNKKDILEKIPNNTIGLEIFVNDTQIEIPIGVFTSPKTLMTTAGFELLNQIFLELGGRAENLPELHKELKRRKASGEDIPHLNSMLKLLEITQWNYEHSTNNQNFVIRFDKNFVLNSKNSRITGVLTPPKQRGKDNQRAELFYPGRRISLDLYRKEMPNRKISDVYTNVSENVVGRNGIVLEKGIPFILVSDYYSELNDLDLYKKFIELETDTTKEYNPLITRVYVYTPTESIDYFLYNLQEQLKKDPSLTAKDLDSTIGNKLTTYRLLSFMLEKDSNFIKVYLDWLNSKFTDGETKLLSRSLERLERMQNILKYIKDYENILVPSATNSTSKLILLFLDRTVGSLENDSTHSGLYDLFRQKANQHIIGNTNWTIRTTLLWEFRKLLLSDNYYEDTNTSPQLSTNNSYLFSKTGDEKYEYKEHLIPRIEALKLDAARNNWNEIMFHTSLEKNSEITVNDSNNRVHRIARINSKAGTYISSREIELNGKLDSTAVITNVEPVMDEILSKLVLKADGSVCSEMNESLSVSTRKKIYEENTKAYYDGINPETTVSENDKKLELLNKVMNSIEPSSDLNILELSKKIKDYIDSDENFETFLNNNNIKGLLNTIFFSNNAVISIGNNYKIIPLPEGHLKLAVLDNEVYYLYNDRIFTASNKEEVVDINKLQLLLNNGIFNNIREASSIVLDYINKVKLARTEGPQTELEGLLLLNQIFGENTSFKFSEMIDLALDPGTEDTLIDCGVIEPSNIPGVKPKIDSIKLFGVYFVTKLDQETMFEVMSSLAEGKDIIEVLNKQGIQLDLNILKLLEELINKSLNTLNRFDCIHKSE